MENLESTVMPGSAEPAEAAVSPEAEDESYTNTRSPVRDDRLQPPGICRPCGTLSIYEF